MDKYVVHHVDKNTKNDRITNLKVVTRKEHEELHYDDIKENCLYNIVSREKITSIKHIGID